MDAATAVVSGASAPQGELVPPVARVASAPAATVQAPASDGYAPVVNSGSTQASPAAATLREPAALRATPTGTPTGPYGALLRKLPGSVTDANDQPVRPNLQRYTLLYFGGKWCPFCRQFGQELAAQYPQLRPGGDFEVLYVSADQPGQRGSAMREMPWLGTNPAMTQNLNAIAKVRSYPTVVVIDANGDEVARMSGVDMPKIAPYLRARSAPGPDPVAESVAFERSFRSGGRPITPASLSRIVPMGPDLWTPDQIIAHYNATRRPEHKGILVVAKTEFCSSNGYRACAVTTAVLEKRFPELKVYMAWIHHPDAFRAAGEPRSAKASLDQRIVRLCLRAGPGRDARVPRPAHRRTGAHRRPSDGALSGRVRPQSRTYADLRPHCGTRPQAVRAELEQMDPTARFGL